MNREDVYKLIDGERDYQDEKWDGKKHDSKHTVANFLIYIEFYLQEAKACMAAMEDDDLTLDNLRKVTALGVAALEQFGAPERGISHFTMLDKFSK